MFYSYAEKQSNGLFGAWEMRQVAFDTSRRYLYYSAPIPKEEQQMFLDTASERAAKPEQRLTQPHEMVWKKKIKLTVILPVATQKPYNLADPRMQERDLYQLMIHGEERPIATGEIPAPGPLLVPSAGLSDTERSRCTPDNVAYLKDPFFLKELFDALRDQFEQIEHARRKKAEQETTAGHSPKEPAKTATLESPRGHSDGAVGYKKLGDRIVPLPMMPATKGKAARFGLRFRDEREFRRFWYTLQIVLGYDKLIVRPYRGLPPYDPRNSIAFAHVPMCVWDTFKALDKAVFYTFSRGDVMRLTASGDVVTEIAGAYLCISHDMVYMMRDTGNIPRWVRLNEISEFHFKKDGTAPFVAFLADAPNADLLFVPRPPIYGPEAVARFDPKFDVLRTHIVMHDACFASLSIRRVLRIAEVEDDSLQAYATRLSRSPRPLRTEPEGNYHSTMSCPLPKEQLASVWQQVQMELAERGDLTNRAAIPIYETNATDLQLSAGQLQSVARELDDERGRRDEIVGMSLERARRLQEEAITTTTTTARSTARQDARPDRRRGSESGTGAHHRDPAAGAVLAGSTPSAPTTAPNNTTVLLPLTFESLHTPQIQGAYEAQERLSRRTRSHSVASSSCATRVSEYSSYLVPGTRYITQEEVESDGVDAGSIRVDQHVVVVTSTEAGSAPKPACGTADRSELPVPVKTKSETAVSGTATGTKRPSGGHPQRRPERTINELVDRSMAAMGSTTHVDELH